MNWQSFAGLALAAFAGGGNALGGWLVTRRYRDKADAAFTVSDRTRLDAFTHVGAGILLAVTLLEFLPTALDTVRPRAWAAPIVLIGYLLVHLTEHTVVPHLHGGSESAPAGSVSPSAIYSVVVGLSIHALFDGVAIGAAAHLSRSLGIVVFAAILAHKVPVGATVASVALAAGVNARKAFWTAALLGAATPLGALLVFPLTAAQMGTATAFGAGVMLYVAATELIPAGNETKKASTPCLVIVGVCLFVITEMLMKQAGLE